MANSLCKFSTFFICLALLFSNEHTVKGEDTDGDGLCLVLSGLFGGPCFDNNACNNLCKGAEGEEGGHCAQFMCKCIKKCQRVCKRPSGRFGGLCGDSDACNNLCKGGEGAIKGTCNLDLKCICYYNC